MRHRTALTAMLFALLLLTACAQGGAPAAPVVSSAAVSAAEPPVSLPAPAAAVSAGGSMSAVSTVNAPAPLTEQEILSAYDRASEAYAWFTRSPLPCDGAAVEVEGTLYQPVDDDRFPGLEDLYAYLEDLFSADLAQKLLDTGSPAPVYRDVDGALYARQLPPDRGAQRTGRETLTVEQVSGTAYQVNSTVEILAEDMVSVTGVECFSFPYSLVDGRWVFTDFTAVR